VRYRGLNMITAPSRGIFTFAVCVVLLFLVSNSASANSIYFNIESDNLSEPVSVDGALHEWRGGFYDGDRAYTHDRIETGWRRGKINMGYVRRFDYEVDMNADTAEFFYRVKNKLDLTAGRVYDVDFSVRNSYSHGIHIQYWLLERERLKLQVGVSLLQGISLTEGNVNGRASVLSNSDYDFDVGLDYFFTKDVIFNLPVDSPSGYGLGNDVYFYFRINSKQSTEITARDILGAIYWLKTPHITAQVSSDTKTYDQDGWVRYDPVLSGRKSYRGFTQMLPMRVDIKWLYDWTPSATLYTTVHYHRLRSLFRLGANYKLSSAANLDLSAVDAGAVTLGGQYRQFKLSVSADSLSYSRAHLLSLTMYFVYQL